MGVTTNDHVRTLQAAMGTGVDGMWGNNTSREFTKFLEGIQEHLGIEADGWYGDQTNEAIRAAVEAGTMDAEVGEALIALYESGDLNSLHSGRADDLHEQMDAGTYTANETDAAEVAALFSSPEPDIAAVIETEVGVEIEAEVESEPVIIAATGIEPFADEVMPDPQAGTEPDNREFFVRLEERAADVEWTNEERALALSASIYAVENMPIEEALEITQANADGRFATVFHKVLQAMDILAEGSVHQGFFDAVFVDGRSVEDATAEFGPEARLAHDMEQTLIDRNLLNIGDGTIEVEFPNAESPTDLISSADPLQSEAAPKLAFVSAVMMPPEEAGGYRPEFAANMPQWALSA